MDDPETNLADGRPKADSTGWLGRLRHWWPRPTPRRLRLCENLPLGDKRFVAVVEFDSWQFLVGGTPSSITLLSRIPSSTVSAPEEAQP